ncbi:MAG: 4Fe-4S binding protein [Christensenellales bacterium]|jgi:heterodisulfide reductase subunit A-like polyferredoxin
MGAVKAKRRRAQIDQGRCVACGCCVRVCRLHAIEVYRGMYAQIDEKRCVGCGKCVKECPAGILTIAEVQA